MGRKLPPLNALRAFEVAARAGNFTKAAKILNVSQGAVDRHIAQLEAFLGLRLFVRNQRDVRLTPQGVEYAQVISEAFDRIEFATQANRQHAGNRVVRIRLFPTVAMKWLIGRLGRFQALHPTINVQVTIANDLVDMGAEEIDFSIQIPAIAKPGIRYDKLFPIALVPVCSPDPPQRGRRTTANRARSARSHIAAFDETAARTGVAWFGCGRRRGPASLREGLTFGNSSLAYQAAIDGLGIAMGHVELVQDDLNAGRLMVVHPLVVRTLESYHLVGREADANRSELAAFRDWLLAEIESDRMKTAGDATPVRGSRVESDLRH